MKDPLGDAPPVETRKAVTGLLVAVAAVALILVVRPSAWVTVSIIGGLVLTIMLHELGHFLAAKRAGMKVTEFFLGFGPRLWSFRRGETEYGVKLIPAGGYVRIIGMSNLEEVDPEDEPRTYRQSTYLKKLAVVLAGVTVNMILVFVLVFTVLLGRGEDRVSTSIGSVSAGSPAAAAGLRPGDRIVSIGGVPVDRWDTVAEVVRPSVGKELDVVVERDGQTVTLQATPQVIDGVGRIGVTAAIETQRRGPLQAFGNTFTFIGRGTTQTIGAMGRLFSPSGVEKYSKTVTSPSGSGGLSEQERPRSVIGIVADGGQIVQGDVWTLLGLLAAVNLFLALFNLIPLVPFDGGHAVVATYEAAASRIKGRRIVVDQRKLMPVTAAVMVMLVFLGLSTMYLDVRSIFNG